MIKQNTQESNFSHNLVSFSSYTQLESPKYTLLNYLLNTDFIRVLATAIYSIFLKKFPLTQTCKLDYISFTSQLDKTSFEKLVTLLVMSINTTSLKVPVIYSNNSNHRYLTGKRGKYYRNKLLSNKLITVFYTYSYKLDDYNVFVRLTGFCCSKLTTHEQHSLIANLREYQVNLTRLDIKIDDITYKLIPLNKMIKAVNDKNHFHFKEYKYVKSTCYFGDKTSRKLAKVYDHKGKFLRYEVRFRDKYAKNIFNNLSNLNVLDFQLYLASIALGAMDFRHRGKLANPQKAYAGNTKRLPFWHNFTANKLGIEPRRL